MFTSSYALNDVLIRQRNLIFNHDNEGVRPPAAPQTFLIFQLSVRINPIRRAEKPSVHVLGETADPESPTDPDIAELGERLLLGNWQTAQAFNTLHRDLWLYTVECFTESAVWTLCHHCGFDGWTGWVFDQCSVMGRLKACVCVYTYCFNRFQQTGSSYGSCFLLPARFTITTALCYWYKQTRKWTNILSLSTFKGGQKHVLIRFLLSCKCSCGLMCLRNSPLLTSYCT